MEFAGVEKRILLQASKSSGIIAEPGRIIFKRSVLPARRRQFQYISPDYKHSLIGDSSILHYLTTPCLSEQPIKGGWSIATDNPHYQLEADVYWPPLLRFRNLDNEMRLTRKERDKKKRRLLFFHSTPFPSSSQITSLALFLSSRTHRVSSFHFSLISRKVCKRVWPKKRRRVDDGEGKRSNEAREEKLGGLPVFFLREEKLGMACKDIYKKG